MFYKPKIFIITPVYNRQSITKRFLNKIKNIKYDNFEQIIIDDGSEDGTSNMIRKSFPWVILLKGGGHLYWSGATNLGVKYALKNNADYVLTMNDDTDFNKYLLQNLVNFAIENKDTIVAPTICYFHKRSQIWMAGTKLNLIGLNPMYRNCNLHDIPQEPYEVDAHTGMCVLYPVEIFKVVAFFDEKNFPLTIGDTDFTLRCKKMGYKNIVIPNIYIYNDTKSLYESNPYVKPSLKKFVLEIFKKGSVVNLKSNICFYFRHQIFYKAIITLLIRYLRYWVYAILLIILSKKDLNRLRKYYRKKLNSYRGY